MRILINERLSEHKYKTPEGYLICTDAIIARTGKQEYRKNEIFADSDDDSIIELDRPADEVFSEKTIASFENKPLVNEHPDEDVNTENYKDYAVGFIRDVHKGTVDGQDVLLANLVFTDKDAIDDIESGRKNELSCGYDCDIVDEKNPKQTNIRGNHVALCERGRAGIAKIVDSVKDDRYIIMRKSGAGEEIYSSDNKQDILDELESLGRNYMVYDDKTKKVYSIKEFKSTNDSIKDNSIFYKAYVDGKVYFSDDRDKLEKMNPEKIYVLEKDGDVIKDVNPRSGESKEDFISRFMSETKEEYPDEKQRLAVAYSYWKKGKDSMVKDSLTRQERELCDYMLENAYEKGMTAERLWRKMLVYYSEYANLARSKKEDVLDYFEEEIENSMYDSTPYEKQTKELEKSEERFEDANRFWVIVNPYKDVEICNSFDKAEKLKNSQMYKNGTIYEVDSNIDWYIQSMKKFGQGEVYSDLLYDIKKGVAKKVNDSINDAVIGVDEEIFNKITQNEHVTKEVTKLNEIARKYNANKRTMYQVILFWTGKDDVAYELSQKLNIRDSIKDAQTYVIKYKLLEYNMITKREFNANSVEEALKQFARQIGAQGVGTYNVFVSNVSPNDGYISLYGRLSKLLEEFNIKDSVKDSKHIKAIKAIKAIKQHQDSKVNDSPASSIFNEIKAQYPGVKFTNIIYQKDENNYVEFRFDIIGDLPANLIRFNHVDKQPFEKYVIYVMKKHGFPRPHVSSDDRNGTIKCSVTAFTLEKNLKDSKVKDSDRLKQLAYKFAQQANYFDKANFAHSREILSKDDEQKWVEFKRTALEVKKQLEVETKNVKTTTKGDYFGSSDNETIQLLRDANDTLYFKSKDKSDKMPEQLSKQLDNLLTIYSDKIYNPYYGDSDSKVKDVSWDRVQQSKLYTGYSPKIFGKGDKFLLKDAVAKYGKANLYETNKGKFIITNEDRPTLVNCWLDYPQGSYQELGTARKISDDNKIHTTIFYD